MFFGTLVGTLVDERICDGHQHGQGRDEDLRSNVTVMSGQMEAIGKRETAAPALARAFLVGPFSAYRVIASGGLQAATTTTPRLEVTPGVETGAPRHRSLEPVRIGGHPIRRRFLYRHYGAPQRNSADVHDTGLPRNPAPFRNHCAKPGNGTVHLTTGIVFLYP